MNRLGEDIRLALRGFRRSPAFIVTAVIILALGIGTSVAMFTIFRTVLVRRLPVADQDRVVVMWTYVEPSTDLVSGAKDLDIVRHESRTMRDIAAVAHYPAYPSTLVYGDQAIVLNTALVTGNFFDVLGARPVLGRLLRPSDDDTGPFRGDGANASRTLVLSYKAWRQKFGGDSTIVGKHLVSTVFGWEYTVVGVAPQGLDYPAGVEYWMPLYGGWQFNGSTFAVARLRPGASVAAARDEYFAISNRLAPGLHLRGAHAATFTDTVLGTARPILVVLTIAVALLLFIACLNVGNLLLLRASSRARELSVRRALGATYADIAQQLVVEAAAVAVIAGAAGFALAEMLMRVFVASAPPGVPRLDDVEFNGAPVATAIGISVLAVLCFGVVPTLFAARAAVGSPLRGDARAGRETTSRRAARQTLVAAQVALAMITLGGAALLARSLARLEHLDAGYVSDHLSILSFTWNAASNAPPEQVVALGDRLVSAIARIPGVSAATPIMNPPLEGEGIWQVRPMKDGQTVTEATANPAVPAEIAGADFFKTFGVQIVRGRAFTNDDRGNAPLVAIMSESAARMYWPGENPIGKRIRFAGGKGNLVGGDNWRTVVGIARDANLRDVHHASAMVYFPMSQFIWQGYAAIRTTSELAPLVPALRTTAKEADSHIMLSSAHTMDQLLSVPLSQPRLGALLMSSFGGVALLLAAIGLYGVMSALVRDQTREIGIRVALGAPPASVRDNVLRRAMGVTLAGAGIGFAAVLVLSRFLVAVLFQVSPTDPESLAGAAALLLVVSGAAAYVPARRAMCLDPLSAIREE
ncbi:MAG: ADOP family duplicated permease [Gemmatimonadaceae bacterium]